MRALYVYRRKDGLWCAQINLPNGKRKTKYAKSQKETRDWSVLHQNTVRLDIPGGTGRTPAKGEIVDGLLNYLSALLS